MTPITDQISTSVTQTQIVAPKLIGSLAAGILAAFIAYRQMPHPNALDAIIAGLTLMVPLLGGGLSALGVASKTNPAGVTNVRAARVAPPGTPNVTSEPVATPEAKAELRG